ncbi:MAG: carbohydrate-binding domain-containing protein, partial [Clostridiales bacterium]|nr:carbohydrate-binding domain-containing protein [Clostridiales bacterium]
MISLFLAAALLTSCGIGLSFTGEETAGDTTPSTGGSPDTAEITSARDADDNKVEITGSFSLVSADGKGSVSRDGSVWKITAAGVYTAKGLLEDGRIEVTAGADDEVEIDLDGASISSSDAAPVAFLSCGEAKLKAVEGSYNEITDRRPAKAADAAETDSTAVTPETAGGAVY